jgi:hypothetical protein
MKRDGEIFHTNSIYVFDAADAGSSPLFVPGHALISVLYLDTIAIVDLERDRVVWALEGPRRGLFVRQHEPEPLPSGELLLFDNQGHDGRSKVVALDPRSGAISWTYASADFYSETCGVAQRLPNGNTLITESDAGRAFEVTPSGDVVWEFYVPHRVGRDGELIATLFEVRRVPAPVAGSTGRP